MVLPTPTVKKYHTAITERLINIPCIFISATKIWRHIIHEEWHISAKKQTVKHGCKARRLATYSKIKPRIRAEWEVSSVELCILTSWFFSPIKTKFSLREIKGKTISSHIGRDPLKNVLTVKNAWVKVEWVEREAKLSIIYIKVVVKGKGRDRCTWRRVEGREQSLGKHYKRKYERTRGCYHI